MHITNRRISRTVAEVLMHITNRRISRTVAEVLMHITNFLLQVQHLNTKDSFWNLSYSPEGGKDQPTT
jgi:hypothetical protein